MQPEIQYRNFIDGKWVDSDTGEKFERENPANRERASITPLSGPSDMEKALDAARTAFDTGRWSEATGDQRSKFLLKFATLLEENIEKLALVETLENGKVLKNSVGEVMNAIEYLLFFAGLARNIKGETFSSQSTIFSLVLKEPVGVCGLIVPWNSPIDLAMRKLAPALAAGCTVVVKPSSNTPATILQLGDLLEKVELPPGVVNIVAGSGGTVGETLVKSRKVDKISFTGDTVTGKKIMSLAAPNLKRISVELGGKAANIVFEDASLDRAAPGSLWAIFRNCGQSCTAGSRLLIHEAIHDEFIKRLKALAASIRVGSPLEAKTDMGPVVSGEQLNKIMGYVVSGVDDGAKLVIGGERLEGGDFSKGYFVKPTIFDGVEPRMRIAQEEIFGPLLSVMTFTSEEEAVVQANSTVYGLAGAIWTKDLNRMIRVAKKVQAGELWVNGYATRLPAAPFGGYKSSGIGRELGERGLEEYLEYKHVCIDTAEEYQRVIR